MKCQRCGLPFTPPAWPGMGVPICRCWQNYSPPSGAAPFMGTVTIAPLTEADVRRIVAEEFAKLAQGGKEG